MRAIKKLIISLVIIIGIVAVALIGVYIAARVKLGVDLFRTVGQLKTLSQPVNEQEAFPAAYQSEDLADLKSQTESQLGDVVLYEEGKGYEGYTVDFTALALSGATAKPVVLSEQQAGALAETVFYQQTGGKLSVAGKEISACVLQIAFTEVDSETGNADLNVTVKLDLTPFKNGMEGFPFNLLKGIVPDALYVTSVVRIEKGEGLAYTVTPKYLTLNNLSGDDTSDFFHTLSVVLKIGSAEDLNAKIGTTAANALIGTEENPGFVYALKATGGSGSFGFVNFEKDGKQINVLAF
ncbi:MAG: hypothetical protein SPH68_01345 [Candidatus Borkfalkiaceae bacterium]|nr:hypothetical protein [Clostridia bacterium]MDY6222789.1 hypothetical protein [Christensenellaceae bacterium]